MCGILAIIGKGKDVELVKSMSKRMSHRGPDESDLYVTENGHVLSHERLSIIDLHSGRQPIQGTSTAYMIHNGEIYNHQELRDGILKHHTFRTKSDSEVIVHLYEEFGYDFLDKLDGDFAFVVVDGDDFIAGRDPLGVKPLYYGIDERGRTYFASEMKPIADQCKTFATFPPGHFYTPKTGFVKINVYDVLGKNVRALVNERLTAGSYQVTFDAGYFPSGIYFYKLETENFSEVKRMTLLK
ncbi:MAG: T9SS type A sorting domain-containing protein [Flavobacterium sp.]